MQELASTPHMMIYHTLGGINKRELTGYTYASLDRDRDARTRNLSFHIDALMIKTFKDKPDNKIRSFHTLKTDVRIALKEPRAER